MLNIKRKKKEDDLTYLERVYIKTLKKNPKSFLYLPLASIYYHKGAKEKAIETLKHGISVNSNYVTAEYYLATLYRENDDVDKAVEMFKMVTLSSRDHYAAHKALAHYYLEKKDEKNALIELKELTRLVPSDVSIHDKINRLEQKLKKAAETLTPATKDVLVSPPEAEEYNEEELTHILDEVEEEIKVPGIRDTATLSSKKEDEEKTGKDEEVSEIKPHQLKKQIKDDKQDDSEKIVSSLQNWLKNINRISQDA